MTTRIALAIAAVVGANIAIAFVVPGQVGRVVLFVALIAAVVASYRLGVSDGAR